MFRTRQAPSPTGYLHIGTARTVLFSKLLALVNSGIYYIRLDDTDQNRLQQDSPKILLKALAKIGLAADEGLTLEETNIKNDFYDIYQNGNLGSYIQSERLDLYHHHAQKLIDRKLAYWNYLSAEQKQELQEIKQINKQPINYFEICLEKFGEEKMFVGLKEGLSNLLKPVLMYKLQRKNKIICHDLLLGQTEFDLNLEEDFSIIKSDSFPTYHFAHLIDDNLMQTSLVVRSQEWYPSLPKHVVMFQDYWGVVPNFIHLPFILGETGNKKMSKRDGNVNLQNYLDEGYLPEAIINYIAFLGWNPGTEKEMYLDKEDFLNLNQEARLAKLIDNISNDFSIDKLSKSPARFNLEKLNWFNKQYIAMLSLPEFVSIASQLEFIKIDYSNEVNSQKNLDTIAASSNEIVEKSIKGSEEKDAQLKYLYWYLDQNRANLINQIGLESSCITNWQKPDFSLLMWKNSSEEQTKINLKLTLEYIQSVWSNASSLKIKLVSTLDKYIQDANHKNQFEEDFYNLNKFWEDNLKNWIGANGHQPGNIFWPLRVSLSGKNKSPSPFELLAVLSLEEVESRIESLL